MSSSAERTAAFDQDAIARVLDRHNPLGLGAVTYRGAIYQNALARMLARLPRERVGPKDGSEPPLAHLNVEADDDWAVALVHAWAVVAEVLSFYQERIVNEGYLRTATERRSVLELARSIGYELRPGVAASTHLAVTVQSRPGETHCQVEIPAGTAVQGMSPTAELPAVFETSEALSARSDLNALKLDSKDRPATIWPGTTSIRLAGDGAGLQVGDQILIIEDHGKVSEAGERWLLVVVSEVKVQKEKDYALVSWQDVTPSPGPHLPLRNARLYVLRQVGGLFTYTQAAVDSMPAGGEQWRPAGIGLPQAEVHSLVSSADGHLFAGTKQDIFRSVDNGASWQPAHTSSLQRNVTALAVDGQALYAGTDAGGIYLSQDNGHNWEAMSGEEVVPPPKWFKKWLPVLFRAPLPKTTVRSLAILPQRGKPVLAAGTDDGIFCSTDQGKTWRTANFALPGRDWKTGRVKTPVWALALVRRGWQDRLFAGTQAGVFGVRETPRLWPFLVLGLIPALLLRALSDWNSLVAYLLAWAKYFRNGLAGFVSGIRPDSFFGSLLHSLKPINDFIKELPGAWPSFSGPWAVLNAPLAFVIDVLLAAVVAVVVVFLAMAIGRFVNSRRSRCLGRPVYALVAGENGRLFAGTAGGVYRSYGPKPLQDGSSLGRFLSRLKTGFLQTFMWDWQLWDWRPETENEKVPDVRALAAAPLGAAWAGTANGELFRCDKEGKGWVQFDQDLRLADVQATLTTKHGQFAAGRPDADKNERRWFLSQIEKGQIDLDQEVPAIAAGNWVVLQQTEDPRKAKPYRVAKATLTSSQDLNRAGQFTRLAVKPDADLDNFDRETTAVWAAGEPLALFDDRPVCGDTFTLAGVVPGLAAGHNLIVSGSRIRVRVAPDAGELILRSADGLQTAALLSGELLQLMSSSQPTEPGDGLVRWELKNRRGFAGNVKAHAEALVEVPAAKDDEIVAEVAVVARVDYEEQTTHITLQAPLKNRYDRANVTIYGNVVPAMHGRTVQDEVLGSGDGSQANQRFRLRQGPLSFNSTPTPGGVEPRLKVKVNGVLWHQEADLQGLRKGRRAYMVRQDARGNTDIIFGDGEQGARLPSGHEQITATYRIGRGSDGNMPAGTLIMLQSALPGIASVSNPVPASGGKDRDDLGQARQNAPCAARAMDRFLSLTDYEDFVRRFAGIGKAQADLMPTVPRDLLHITIADSEGKPIDRTSDLYQMLVRAIDENRDQPGPKVVVNSHELVYFDLQAWLLIDPDHRERQQDIEDEVRSRIGQSFALNARELGQDVSASELISLMQDTPGVVAVQLKQLYLSTQEPGLDNVLHASRARWQEGQPLPAQMLVVNAEQGVTLDLEVAS